MIRFLGGVLIGVSIAGCSLNQDMAGGGQSATVIARPGDALVAKVAEGGYLLYIRHGKTDPAFQDKQDKPNWWKTCDTRSHRPLSDEGRAQMLSIGAQMRELRIPVAKVLSSEYCRAADSAFLLQLMPVIFDPALNYTDAQRYAKRGDVLIASDLRALFSTAPPPGRNTVLVGHVHGFNPPIDLMFSQVQEAETIVIRPLAEGKFEIVGRIAWEKWALRAR